MRAAGLDAHLTRWSLPGGPFDPDLLAAHDETETFPAEACAALDTWGMPEHYVPLRYGGRQERLEETHALLRKLAARDMTVAVGHGKTFLGGACVWAAADNGPAEMLARHVLAGEPVAWGLTEPGNGSDLLANTLTATRNGSGWLLNGRKWPVNNATRGRFMCVLARTDEAGGARGFTVFLIDKRATPEGTVRPLPKMPTHGIRGADISGLEFHDTRVPAHALVGTVGGGVELVLKALQLTRIACVALSLGAGDHALTLLRRFLFTRKLYGKPLADLPHARNVAGRSVARQFLAEALAHTAARAAHEIPEELSLVSAVAKASVPGIVQGQLRLIGDLLGARGFLTEVEGYGPFAKLERDHQVVPVFDGSTWVNRAGLAAALPLLRPGGPRAATEPPNPPDHWLREDHESTPLDAQRLRLMAPRDSVLGSLPRLVAGLAAEPAHPATTTGAQAETVRLARALLTAYERLGADLADVRPTGGTPSTAVMRLAERYEWCWAGAAALALHRARPQHHDGVWWQDALWLRGCLALALDHLGDRQETAGDVYDRLGGILMSEAGARVTVLDAHTRVEVPA
ncbi:acyl-CoA dehydrogenase family protein [Streptomyces sp. NPDC004111]|uniref:acyl-CoA dehydrogenase family protein n=1 Tax=Streptomyces sp. NPDC004111 TaxID=3364690 RepID=UPI0036B490BC